MSNPTFAPTQKEPSETTTVRVQPVGKIHPSSSDALNIVMRGRVGTAVEFATYPSGASMAKFRLAVSRKGRDDAGQWHELGVTWYTVRMWGKLAEHASRSLRKGEPVLVSGRLEVNQWVNENSGTRGMDLAVVATSVGHDLNFGMAFFNKVNQPEHAPQQSASAGTSLPGSWGGGAGSAETPRETNLADMPGETSFATVSGATGFATVPGETGSAGASEAEISDLSVAEIEEIDVEEALGVTEEVDTLIA